MTYFERATCPRRKQRGVPCNRHKQWHCDPFVSGNNAHSPLRVIVRRHSSKFRLNCALFVTILKFGTQRETIKESIFSYRTTLTEMPFPWKLNLNELHVKSYFLHVFGYAGVWAWLGAAIQKFGTVHRHGNHNLIYA